MSAHALLLVPPLLKYTAGPTLGPALLASAGQAAGHCVEVLDLNIHYLRARAPWLFDGTPTHFTGDHDKPREALRVAQREFSAELLRALPEDRHDRLDEDPALTLVYEFDEVAAAVGRLVVGPVGTFVRDAFCGRGRPDVVGVSVMYSGQVLWGLVASAAAKACWPGAKVVWGGPHVTALGETIASDPVYGRLVDGFVCGQAERTWVDLLDAVAAGQPMPARVHAAGGGTWARAEEALDVVPRFDDLGLYDSARLTLPAQCSRGCSRRCDYCTYWVIEGRRRELPLGPLRAVVEQAAAVGAAVSLKDSYLSVAQLKTLAAIIGGRVRWSACTALDERLDVGMLRALAVSGCATLELGLETLSATAQELVGKIQDEALYRRILDAAQIAGVTLVINYITGFPGEDPAHEGACRRLAEQAVDRRRPVLKARFEHNRFQLERASLMGRRPHAYGIRVNATWPWSTVMGWSAAS